MTVATTIEIGAGATPASGLGKALGPALGAGRAGAATFELLSSTVSAATSFRANWQSLLASLNSSMEGFREDETDQGTASAVPASGQVPDQSSVSTLTAGIRLLQGQAVQKGSVETGAIARLSMAGARTQALVAEPVAKAAKPASARNEETRTAAEPETESVRSSRLARSINVTRPDTVPAEPLPALLPAAITGLSQAEPANSIASTVAHNTDVPARPAQTEISVKISTDQPSASASASTRLHPLERNAPGTIAETVSQAVQQPAEGSETHTQQRQTSPAPSQSGLSGPTLSETEVSLAIKDTPPSVAMLAEGESTLATPATARSLTQQTATQTASPAETLAPSQASSPTLAPEQSLTHPLIQDQNLFQIAAPSQNQISAQVASPCLTQTTTSSKNTTETLATGQAPSQSPLPIQHSIQAQVASPSLTQITALNTNPAETLVTNQASSPSLVFNPSRTPSLVQYQEQGPAQSINQIVNVVASPMPGNGLNPLPMVASVTASQLTQLATQSPVLSNPASASGGKASSPETVRSERGTGKFDSVQQVSHLIAAQSSIPAVDASPMARALTGAGGVVNTGSESTGASSVTPSRQDSREAFATLDATGTPGAPAWIHAGAQRAEAGYQDPALGWVSVRADLSGGGVHAQLVPGSADAAQVLGSHLTGLNAYLAEHHTPVETLTLTSPNGGWSGLSSGRGAGEGMQQGAGQQSAQNADASAPSDPYPESVIKSPAASAQLPAFLGDMDGSAQAASLGSFHISVMA